MSLDSFGGEKHEDFERDVKIILYEMVEEGELQCNCSDCDCRLFVDTDF